jgi:hypothetical protein
MFHVGGREPVKGLEYMEVRFAAPRADHGRDGGIARAQPRVEIDKLLLRLDRDALPAALVEEELDIVSVRVAGADNNVGTIAPSAEGEPEVDVFHVLRVGKLHGYSSAVRFAKLSRA